jgi:DNA-binding NarL/FixJ family response regulator
VTRAPRIRVIIADDHHLVRQGIRSLLEKASDIEVVGEAADGQEAIGLVERLIPDVLVTDVAMPRLDGNQVVERVRAMDAATQVIILSMYSDEALVRQTLRNGAKGYLLKQSVTEELLLAIRAASQGEVYLSPAISGSIIAELLALEADAGVAHPSERLTPREREILQLISEGNTNSAIARLLKVSVKTVEKHRANLMSKLDVHDLAGLMRAAIRHGLIFLDK